ncbi:hypothetical protein NFI96_024901 [Prochilodus magdalenae]|nr:hypothetical protein NFI96_024901 [Prochilodus magdalenae]
MKDLQDKVSIELEETEKLLEEMGPDNKGEASPEILLATAMEKLRQADQFLKEAQGFKELENKSNRTSDPLVHVSNKLLEHPHTVPADGAVGVEVEGHQAFWTCDNKPFILVLTTVPPHTDSLGVSTKTKAGLVTEDDPLSF